jgi:hypothetical protein
MMGPLSSVNPVAATAQTAGHQTGTMNGGAGTSLRNGARTPPAAEAETARPVAQAIGAEWIGADAADLSAANLTDPPAVVQSARDRAEAAHRAYTMAALAAGVNPLNDPVP